MTWRGGLRGLSWAGFSWPGEGVGSGPWQQEVGPKKETGNGPSEEVGLGRFTLGRSKEKV